MSFKNKVVIITGASSGIGAAAAIAFSAEGARVVIVGRNEKKLADVAKKCNKPLVISADVSKDEDAKKIIEETLKKFGELHILINNAGFSGLDGSLLSGSSVASYDAIMSVNVRAVVHLTSLASSHLVKTKGNIINISSIASKITSIHPSTIHYHVSKAALDHFTICAAAELGPHGVRVNAIAPGPVKTDFISNSSNFNFVWNDFIKFTALGRVSDSEEVADLILFLASEKAKSITGSIYTMDNGVLVKRN